MRKLLLLFVCLGLLSFSSFGQTITSAQAGPWNVNATWIGGVIPTNANSTLIQLNHNVNVPSGFTATVDQVRVAAGRTLAVDAGGTLSLQNSGGTDLILQENFLGLIGSTLDVSGDFINNSTTAINYGVGLSSVIYNSGGRYVHAIDGGSFPDATTLPVTWATTSTVEITGVTTTTPTNLNQDFGNFTWNSAGHSGSVILNLQDASITGNLTISNTGATASNVLVLTNAGGNLNVFGNFDVSGTSRFAVASGTSVNMNIAGNFNFTSTNTLPSFIISASGTVNFNVAKNFTVSGRFSANAGGTANVNFIGSLPQLFNTTGGTLAQAFNWTIKNGSIVDMGTSAFVGNGTFTLENGGTMKVGSPDGINTGATLGNVRLSSPAVNRNYVAGGNIVYNGSVAQNLGNEWGSGGRLNSVAVNLEIANTGGGSVTNNVIGGASVVGVLTLTSGSFNIGNANTLNVQSTFVTTGGTVGGAVNSSLTFSGFNTLGTLSFTPGAQTIQNLTIDRLADLKLGSNLTVSGVVGLTSGNLDISGVTLTMNGSAFSGGYGIISTGTSNLIVGGSTFTGSIPFAGGGQLNTLTLGANPGSYSISTPVTINNNLNLILGTLTHTSGITMGGGATVLRAAGTLTGNVLGAASSYNITYTVAGTGTGLEMPINATSLGNLTVATSGALTLNTNDITINGNATFSSGSLVVGSKNLTMKGATWTIGGGLFNAGTGIVNFGGNTTIVGASSFNHIVVTSGSSLTLSSGITSLAASLSNNGTFNAGGGTIDFTGSTTISGATAPSFNNVTITGTLVAPASFNVAGAWVNNGTFTAGAGTVVFNGTTSISGSTTNFFGVTINGVLNSPNSLFVAGNFTNNGTYNNTGTTLVLNGTATQSISGSVVTTFNNISVTNPVNSPAVRIESDQNLRGVLTLSGSNTLFDADGSANTSVFKLLSSSDSPTADASIAALPAGTGVTGNVTVQRYMSLEGTNNRMYRFISSAVANPPTSQIQAFIPVTGTFSGASSCSGCGAGASMFAYDESVITDLSVPANGNDPEDGYTIFPVSSNTEPLTPGRGYTIYVRGNIPIGSPAGTALWEVRGPINSGAQALPVSFTSSGVPANDGWSLVGNPYPATIDWDAGGWTKSGIDNVTYTLDNATGVYATYAGGGSGTNGGTRYISTGQGFFLKANAGSPVVVASELVKVGGTQTTYFRTQSTNDVLRITLKQGALFDETLLKFTAGATPNFDAGFDAAKLNNPDPMYSLSSLSEDGKLFAISTWPSLAKGGERVVKLGVNQIKPGNYTLDFSGMDSFSDNTVHIMLHDIYKNTYTDLRTTSSYAFEVKAETSSFGNGRFEIVLGAEVIAGLENASSHITIYPNPTNGILSVDVASDNAVSAKVVNIMGATLLDQPLEGGSVKKGTFDLQEYAEGMYILIVQDGANVYQTRIIKKR